MLNVNGAMAASIVVDSSMKKENKKERKIA